MGLHHRGRAGRCWSSATTRQVPSRPSRRATGPAGRRRTSRGNPALAPRHRTRHLALAARHSALRTPHFILYTSGTTGRPKGVVTTHANLEAQIAALVDAWGWRADDRVLHVLPLHHVHGIVNVLAPRCGRAPAASSCAVRRRRASWERLAVGRDHGVHGGADDLPQADRRLGRGADGAARARWAAGSRGLRLMVSGSAALPVTSLERWREITGHTLLERYGMTEIGMALSNPLDGERRPGSSGMPLPGVDVRLVDETGSDVPRRGAGRARGARAERCSASTGGGRTRRATRSATAGSAPATWPCVEDGVYRILGRTVVDIIKTGGYKVSALEIEEVLREHPAVARVRGGRRARRGVGRARRRGDCTAARRGRRRWTRCATGPRRAWRSTSCRRASSRSPRCRAMRWGRWSRGR